MWRQGKFKRREKVNTADGRQKKKKEGELESIAEKRDVREGKWRKRVRNMI